MVLLRKRSVFGVLWTFYIRLKYSSHNFGSWLQYLDMNTFPSMVDIFFLGLIVRIAGLNLLHLLGFTVAPLPATVGLELLSYRVPSFVVSSASRAEESRLSARGKRMRSALCQPLGRLSLWIPQDGAPTSLRMPCFMFGSRMNAGHIGCPSCYHYTLRNPNKIRSHWTGSWITTSFWCRTATH